MQFLVQFFLAIDRTSETFCRGFGKPLPASMAGIDNSLSLHRPRKNKYLNCITAYSRSVARSWLSFLCRDRPPTTGSQRVRWLHSFRPADCWCDFRRSPDLPGASHGARTVRWSGMLDDTAPRCTASVLHSILSAFSYTYVSTKIEFKTWPGQWSVIRDYIDWLINCIFANVRRISIKSKIVRCYWLLVVYISVYL